MSPACHGKHEHGKIIGMGIRIIHRPAGPLRALG